MKSCILRWAGGQEEVPYPGLQRAASGSPLPALGDPGHQAQLGWAPLSSLTPSPKLWTGLSWGLKGTVGWIQSHSSPHLHPSFPEVSIKEPALTTLTIGRTACPPAPTPAPIAAPVGSSRVEGRGGALVSGIASLVTAPTATPAPRRAKAQPNLPQLFVNLQPLQAKLLHLLFW